MSLLLLLVLFCLQVLVGVITAAPFLFVIVLVVIVCVINLVIGMVGAGRFLYGQLKQKHRVSKKKP